MDTFSKEIQNFQRYGTYDYKFDEGGNLVFNVTSSNFNQHFLSIPLANYIHDDVKIGSFYSTNFKEFLPTSTTVLTETTTSTEVSDLQNQNQQMQEKLTSLTAIADSNSTQSDILATKQIILSLREQLGQGTSEFDFSDTFPYLPVTKNKR